jgi:hypothetical protein
LNISIYWGNLETHETNHAKSGEWSDVGGSESAPLHCPGFRRFTIPASSEVIVEAEKGQESEMRTGRTNISLHWKPNCVTWSSSIRANRKQ